MFWPTVQLIHFPTLVNVPQKIVQGLTNEPNIVITDLWVFYHLLASTSRQRYRKLGYVWINLKANSESNFCFVLLNDWLELSFLGVDSPLKSACQEKTLLSKGSSLLIFYIVFPWPLQKLFYLWVTDEVEVTVIRLKSQAVRPFAHRGLGGKEGRWTEPCPTPGSNLPGAPVSLGRNCSLNHWWVAIVTGWKGARLNKTWRPEDALVWFQHHVHVSDL